MAAKVTAYDIIPRVALKLAMQRRMVDTSSTDYQWRGGAARPSQLLPPGDWTIWLLQTGRGWGKTRTGAEAVRELVETEQARRIALVADTVSDAREVMIEGASGILACSPPTFRPVYEPSKRRLTWPNGAIATTYSAETPDQLRGPEHDAAWIDELAKMKARDLVWQNLRFGLRRGEHPRAIVTTTPRPVALLRKLNQQARDGREVVLTTGAMEENAANLAPSFLAEIREAYEGTRTGRQEIAGELLEDVEGAMWRRSWIDAARVSAAPQLVRVVVAIDPSGGETAESAQQGIAVVGKGSDGDFYVLTAQGYRLSPAGWARRAVELYYQHDASIILAEKNYGGAMVKSTLRQIDRDVPLKIVSASQGKVLRAEPVALKYEQGRVHHVRQLDALEDQLCAFPVGDGLRDLVDAAVWGISDLLDRRRMRAA